MKKSQILQLGAAFWGASIYGNTDYICEKKC